MLTKQSIEREDASCVALFNPMNKAQNLNKEVGLNSRCKGFALAICRGEEMKLSFLDDNMKK